MRKIILYIAKSLDGYIATKDLSVDWLQGDSESNDLSSFNEFYDTIDTVILGYNTYKQITTELAKDNWPYQGKITYVITNNKIKETTEIKQENNLKQLLEQLKNKTGKNIWICGGASIVNQVHELNMIDEYIISVIPIILGDGIKLFNQNITTTKLKLINSKHYNGIIDLHYEKKGE